MNLPKQLKEAGIAAEKDVQWRINRALGESKNWVVLHNVLIPDPYSESPCQIDHLLLNRLLKFFVLETKSTKGGCSLTKTNGAWGKFYNGKRQPMPSPIEQNKRHIQCLETLIKKATFIKRWPTYRSWIIVEPGSNVPTRFDNAYIIQRDAIETQLEKAMDENPSFKEILSIVSQETICEIRDYILAANPLKEQTEKNPLPKTRETQATCENCNAPVSNKVIYFCRINKKEFEGKLLCQPCQKAHKDKVISKETKEKNFPKCEVCGTSVDSKVAFYCRLNWQKFGRRLLCRVCQPKN